MKITLLLITALVILGFIAGCNYDNPAAPDYVIQSQNSQAGSNELGTLIDPDFRPLLRANNTRIGTVVINNTKDSIYFKLTMAQGYRLTKLRIHANLGIWSFPLSSNCPNTGAFRLQVNSLPANTTSYLYKVSISTFPNINRDMFGAIYVESETLSDDPDCITAWAAGSNFPGCTGEGMHFRHVLQYIEEKTK